MSQITESDVAPFSLCPVCCMTFFSASEKYKLPSIFHKKASQNKLEKLTRQERLEYASALAETSRIIHTPAGARPSFIQHLFAALGMAVPQKGFPNLKATKVTKYLLYGMFAVTALSLFYLSPEQWKTYIGFYRWGFFDNLGTNFFLSFFAHGSLWHLIGNSHYLRSYGPQVEEKLGVSGFLLLVLTSELLGGFLFSLTKSDIPSVGASGAIMGILTFYGLNFPSEKVGIYIFRVARWIWFPAWSALIILVMQNSLGSSFQIAGNGLSEINYLSHLGGIIAGVLFWLWQKRYASRI
ncbi:MAG: rhomboid family intramembrane serine protease [Oligoflexales bacterium]